MDRYPWLELTLREPVRIAALEIQGNVYEKRTDNIYYFKNVEIMAGMEKTDLTQGQAASAMETKNSVSVIYKGPLKYEVTEYVTFPQPYKTSKYLMIQRNQNGASQMELAEVKVFGESPLISLNNNTKICLSWSWFLN